jgi:hypothetical protein
LPKDPQIEQLFDVYYSTHSGLVLGEFLELKIRQGVYGISKIFVMIFVVLDSAWYFIDWLGMVSLTDDIFLIPFFVVFSQDLV